MPPVLATLEQGARVLLVRLRSLGDCVLTTPAIHVLKTFRPDLRLGVVVEPQLAGVYHDNPYVDAILKPRLSAVAGWRPRLAINLHGGPRSTLLTLATLARWRAGFGHYRYQAAYNLRIPRAQEILGLERKVHTAEHLAAAMFWLGVPRCEIPGAELFPGRGARPVEPPMAVLHPYASAPHKAWPAACFAALARRIRDELGLEPMVIGAARDDFSPFEEFKQLRGAELDAVKAALARAALFIGNDSGPAHMAAAYGLPVVVLYGTSDPLVWAPWRTRSIALAERGGLERLSVDTVYAAAATLRMQP
jgi:ADP-heptose:LPS heptosyltransferase